MTRELVFVTGNKNKAREAQEILGIKINRVDIDIDEIQSFDLEKIAKYKALSAYQAIKKPLIVDDVGFYIDSLNGFPGPFIKYVEDLLGYDKLLQLVKNNLDTQVTVKAAISYHNGKEVFTFLGEVTGRLASEPRGNNGWGFDTIFIPKGGTKTFAELEPKEKNKISHRHHALKKLNFFLNKLLQL